MLAEGRRVLRAGFVPPQSRLLTQDRRLVSQKHPLLPLCCDGDGSAQPSARAAPGVGGAVSKPRSHRWESASTDDIISIPSPVARAPQAGAGARFVCSAGDVLESELSGLRSFLVRGRQDLPVRNDHADDKRCP